MFLSSGLPFDSWNWLAILMVWNEYLQMMNICNGNRCLEMARSRNVYNALVQKLQFVSVHFAQRFHLTSEGIFISMEQRCAMSYSNKYWCLTVIYIYIYIYSPIQFNCTLNRHNFSVPYVLSGHQYIHKMYYVCKWVLITMDYDRISST